MRSRVRTVLHGKVPLPPMVVIALMKVLVGFVVIATSITRFMSVIVAITS